MTTKQPKGPNSVERCGDCQYFDTRRIDGTPFNPSRPERGRCRAKNGLTYGEGDPDRPCVQPPGTFKRRTFAQ